MDVPDALGVFHDGAVAGKNPHVGRVENGRPGPGLGIEIEPADRFPGLDAGPVVGRDAVVVAVAEQAVQDGGEQVRFARRERPPADHVEHLGQFPVLGHHPARIVPPGTGHLHLRGGQAENEDVVPAHRIHDFDIGAVQGADGERPVEGEFHVARARGLHAGRGDLLGEVRRRDDLFGLGHAVVGQKSHPQPAVHGVVGVDGLGHGGDEPDDALGHVIAGRGLAAEQHRARRCGVGRIAAQAVIERNHVQDV